jgi:hypothetical protein
MKTLTFYTIMAPINRDGMPWFSYGLVGFAILLGTPLQGTVMLAFQGWLVYSALQWFSSALRGIISPARTAATGGSSSATEPRTAAEYQRWLFSNTHERLLPNQSINYYRELYLKHRDKGRRPVPSAVPPASSSSSSTSYVRSGGAVTKVAPPPALPASRMALMVLASCSLGIFAAAPLARCVPYLRISDLLPGPLLRPPVPQPVLALLAAADIILGTAHLWLPRAVGSALGALCVSMASHPPRSHDTWAAASTLAWASTGAIIAQLHGADLWLLALAPTLLRLLGGLGELLVFSPLTLPAIRLLIPATVSAHAAERAARRPAAAAAAAATPTDAATGGGQATAGRGGRGGGRSPDRRLRLWPLLVLGALHLLAGGTYVAQSAQRTRAVREASSKLAAGDWRSVLAELAAAMRRGMRPPFPPPPPPGSGGAPPMDEHARERSACDVLGVRVGAEWGEIKAAYRGLALARHPDKLQGQLQRAPTPEEEAEAVRAFRETQEAHDTLQELYERRGDKAK